MDRFAKSFTKKAPEQKERASSTIKTDAAWNNHSRKRIHAFLPPYKPTLIERQGVSVICR
jgi:hypothetical protein